MALPTALSVIIIVIGNLLFSPIFSNGEPSVFTKLLKNREKLEFQCHVRTSVPVQVMHLVDMDQLTAGVTDVKIGPNDVIYSRDVNQWNGTTEFTCLISHPTLAFRSSFTTQFNPGSLAGDEVAISPNYVILLESAQQKSSVSFQCDADFHFVEAVTWSIHPRDSVLDETLSGLNGSMISVEIETGLSKSVMTLETIDLPPDVYHVSCSTRPLMDFPLIEEARLEIAPWNRLDSYNILVPFLIAISGLFVVAFYVLGCYVVISKRLRKRDGTHSSTSGEVKKTDPSSSDNHSLAPQVSSNGFGSTEVTEDVDLAAVPAKDRRRAEAPSEIYYYSENEMDDPIPHPRHSPQTQTVETDVKLIPRPPDPRNHKAEEEEAGHEYENRYQFQMRREMSPTVSTFGKAC